MQWLTHSDIILLSSAIYAAVMTLVRLVPVDVDRHRDADDELGRELGEAEHVPRAAEDVQLAVDRLGAVGEHQGVDVHNRQRTLRPCRTNRRLKASD